MRLPARDRGEPTRGVAVDVGIAPVVLHGGERLDRVERHVGVDGEEHHREVDPVEVVDPAGVAQRLSVVAPRPCLGLVAVVGLHDRQERRGAIPARRLRSGAWRRTSRCRSRRGGAPRCTNGGTRH